jgi:hypothetical protein
VDIHLGTLGEGPTEFYSARLTKKERKRTLAEEVLSYGEALSKFYLFPFRKVKYSVRTYHSARVGFFGCMLRRRSDERLLPTC